MKLTPSDAAADDLFGASVAVDGDVIVVGATHWPFDGGTAYVFRFVDAQWREEARLVSSDGPTSDSFGRAVALRGGSIIVGTDADRAYIFRFDDPGWTQEGRLLPSAAGEQFFGHAVDIDGDLAIVGAAGDDEGSAGSGAAYVFRFDPEGSEARWVGAGKLKVDEPVANDILGSSVGVRGGEYLVGALSRDAVGSGSGAVFVFRPRSLDEDGDGIPDECECHGDLDGSGAVDFGDVLAILSAWGNKGGPEDLDGNGVVDFGDILVVLGAWGPCP